MGWILLPARASVAASDDASFYSVADYRLHHGTLSLGWVAVLLQPAWAPAIVLLGLTILLFPDGRPSSPGWGWVLRVYLAVGSLWLAGALAVAAVAITGHDIRVDGSGNLLTIDTAGSAAWWKAIELTSFPVLGACWLASLASQAFRWRRASDERRRQLKWLLFGTAVCLVCLPLSVVLGSRTVAYAPVTGLLVGRMPGSCCWRPACCRCPRRWRWQRRRWPRRRCSAR